MANRACAAFGASGDGVAMCCRGAQKTKHVYKDYPKSLFVAGHPPCGGPRNDNAVVVVSCRGVCGPYCDTLGLGSFSGGFRVSE